MKTKFVLFLISLTIAAVSSAQEAVDNDAKVREVLALARGYIGKTEKLDTIKALEFKGVLVYGNGDSGTVATVYKKPLRQQLTSVINNFKEVSTLNRTEAWRKVENVLEPGSWSLNFYGIDDIEHMQASARDTLSFYDIPNSRKGRIEYLGTENLNGEKVHGLQYFHSDAIWFKRYFDAETGRLVGSVNNKGIVEEFYGEKIVDGIRFPERRRTRFLTVRGEQSMELTYTAIKVNPKIEDDTFSVPIMAD